MMEREGRLALVVGTFLIAVLAALAALILSLSSERGLFVARYRLMARFENVQGLLPGAPVWLAGKDVGVVETVQFEPIGAELPVLVTLAIDPEVQSHIREDSIATIGTIGVLGDSYVELSVGSAAARMLVGGDVIRATSPINLNAAVEKGTRAMDSVATLADNLNDVIVQFDAEQGSARVAGAVGAAGDLLVRVQEGPGLLHSLIYDDYEGSGIESAERSLASLESILGEIRDGDGILHSLIYDSPREQDLVMQAVSAGARLNNILEKIDRGQGTLGLLVNDPTVYDELQQLLGGARRSIVLRSMVRMAIDDEEQKSPPKSKKKPGTK